MYSATILVDAPTLTMDGCILDNFRSEWGAQVGEGGVFNSRKGSAFISNTLLRTSTPIRHDHREITQGSHFRLGSSTIISRLPLIATTERRGSAVFRLKDGFWGILQLTYTAAAVKRPPRGAGRAHRHDDHAPMPRLRPGRLHQPSWSLPVHLRRGAKLAVDGEHARLCRPVAAREHDDPAREVQLHVPCGYIRPAVARDGHVRLRDRSGMSAAAQR